MCVMTLAANPAGGPAALTKTSCREPSAKHSMTRFSQGPWLGLVSVAGRDRALRHNTVFCLASEHEWMSNSPCRCHRQGEFDIPFKLLAEMGRGADGMSLQASRAEIGGESSVRAKRAAAVLPLRAPHSLMCVMTLAANPAGGPAALTKTSCREPSAKLLSMTRFSQGPWLGPGQVSQGAIAPCDTTRCEPWMASEA